MIINSCLNCKQHSVQSEEGEPTSHCGKENCWSRYSKCITMKALEKFLQEESSRIDLPFSGLPRVHLGR